MAAKFTNAGEAFMLHAALSLGGPLTVHLSKNDFAVEDDMNPAGFVEADYSGYSPQDLVYLGVIPNMEGGRAVASFQDVTFITDGEPPTNLIYGYWVESPDGDVVFAERFTGAARPMNSPTSTIVVSVFIRMWSPT